MVRINGHTWIPEDELEFQAVRAQGPGGQNVNKVASAVQLRFDIRASSLPEYVKQRMLKLNDQRITTAGVVVIKAQEFRSREKNRAAAIERLRDIVRRALATRKKRKPTRPTQAARTRRLESKTRRGRIKHLRKSPPDSE